MSNYTPDLFPMPVLCLAEPGGIIAALAIRSKDVLSMPADIHRPESSGEMIISPGAEFQPLEVLAENTSWEEKENLGPQGTIYKYKIPLKHGSKTPALIQAQMARQSGHFVLLIGTATRKVFLIGSPANPCLMKSAWTSGPKRTQTGRYQWIFENKSLRPYSIFSGTIEGADTYGANQLVFQGLESFPL